MPHLDQQMRMTFDPNFPNLIADLSFLGGHDLLALSKKYRINPESKKLPHLPKEKGYAYFFADIHGNKQDWETIVQMYVKDLTNGTDAYLIGLGDDADALPEYDNNLDHPIAAPFDNPLGKAMFDKNLAHKDEHQKRYVILTYPDDSVQVAAQKLALKALFGDRVHFILGDHELPIVFPGFGIAKEGVNLTNNVRGRITPEEAEYLRIAFDTFPIGVTTENGHSFFHTIPARIKSRKQLEDLVYENPLKKAGFDVDRWIKETLVGGLTFGRIDALHYCRNEKYDSIRVYDEKEIADFLKKLGAQHAYIGHSANSSFIVTENGEDIPIIGGISRFRQFKDFTIVATTEGIGCEHERSGDTRDGPNRYGVYGYVKLDEEFGTVYFGGLGQPASPEVIVKKKNSIVKKERTVKNKSIEQLVKIAETAVERHAFPRKLLDNLKNSALLLERDMKHETVAKAVKETMEYLETTRIHLPGLIDEIPAESHLEPLPIVIHHYFMLEQNHHL